jgi:hypothetical protein
MARKGKKIGKEHYEPKYREAFQQLINHSKPEPKTFLGFKLRTENINQLWRWDNLADVKS